ncbi:uncharacterized protein LOC133527113 [Cydia pomonella]|uniref:uncharacterized protein LOC133527113 n=1 Tax=Cydia pomonella TaxID=82600 RepID=UPI002ADE0C68|nr:uncharacterized protein LOC133527113 [Cydia pomonella]
MTIRRMGDPRDYKPYVAHRLGEIDELTTASEWRYVPTSLNVADVATREDAPPLQFDDVWFQGPRFLRDRESEWPKDLKSSKQVEEALCEFRAVHVEITESLTTDSTIMGLRRMIARRGAPTVIYCDNGTNLKGADLELKRSIAELDSDVLRHDGLVRGIEWKFIPPGAPEMGGAWERMVRTVKSSLRAVLKERAPRPETLSTLMAEVEALVNSRPITYVSTDPNYPEALTPNHFLIGTSSNGPAFGRYDNEDLQLKHLMYFNQRNYYQLLTPVWYF